MSTTPPQKLDRITAGDEYECVAALLWCGAGVAVVRWKSYVKD